MVTVDRLWAPAAAAGLAFVLALGGLLPGVAFWDTAELQVVAPVMGTAHPTGFPTYVILGWLASVLLQPFGEPAFRMNLLSAISVAVAAGVTVDLVRALGGSRWIGLVAGVGLVLTPQVWSIGTHAEAHSLHLALLAILFRLLVEWEARWARARGGGTSAPVADVRPDRWLVAAAVVFGLSVGNHSLTLLLAPPIALYVLAVEPGIVRRPRLVSGCGLALAITLVVVYLELPLRAGPFRAPLVYGRPETWDGFRYIVLAEQFRGSVVDPFGDLPGKFGRLVDLTVHEFGHLAALIPIAFLVTVLRRPRYALLSGTAALITVFFAASYDNAAIERYYLGPELIAWTWLGVMAATAVALVRGLDATRLSALLPASWRSGGAPLGADRAWLTPLSAVVAGVLAAAVLLGPTALDLRDRARAADRSDEDIAARWLDEVVATLEPDAVVVSWWSYSTTLWYGQHVEGRLPGVEIVDDRTRLDENLGSVADVVNRYLGERPVYIIRNDDWQQLEEQFEIEMIRLPMPDSLGRIVGRREERP